MAMFFVTSLILGCDLCYIIIPCNNIPVSYNTASYLYILMIRRKSIHICFSLKKGRSDMTSYPECIITPY